MPKCLLFLMLDFSQTFAYISSSVYSCFYNYNVDFACSTCSVLARLASNFCRSVLAIPYLR